MPCPSCPPQPEDFRTESYDYELPQAAIAQVPVEPRDRSRLLVVTAAEHHHQHFTHLPEWLQSGDLLVLNNTKVIPARLLGRKQTGGKVEALLLERQSEDTWLALVKPGRRIPVGCQLEFAAGLRAEAIAKHPETGGRSLQFSWPAEESFWSALDRAGTIPFPPYVKDRFASDEQYQTVYATQPGAVAAPTAGLHFTPELLQRLGDRGIATTTVTLHVGLGTFRPVEVGNILEHAMHGEWIDVPAAAVEKIRQTQAGGGRAIAVGTTVARSLETAAQSGQLQPFTGKSHLFIYPGYEWKVLDGLITNFHLPQSTLLMMVSAMLGRSRLLDLYVEALKYDYRFYSFGDGMLLLPSN
ncbi:tRNA preQ1(34) S-adenosylmethionine ribosyltransferase-isomerase QueA [Synechococcus sp. PCC 7336]|uniref:tRNA preQ1(34) S-adenosylmethionine ribosyltransferase-isomerase QueA n=1 Tax=Synechococcus sp. PCC 7336 TaxID=195250 RepID=UPI000349D1D5|nr:tRNA preQ1(34) S-adenosylmethionine ribosyltransferase-isomerase QueA [Synechococcus sp. PCC 7336]